MTYLLYLIAAAIGWMARGYWHAATREDDKFDFDYPDSSPPPSEEDTSPDTQPTSPGALDSDLGRLR